MRDRRTVLFVNVDPSTMFVIIIIIIYLFGCCRTLYFSHGEESLVQSNASEFLAQRNYAPIKWCYTVFLGSNPGHMDDERSAASTRPKRPIIRIYAWRILPLHVYIYLKLVCRRAMQ